MRELTKTEHEHGEFYVLQCPLVEGHEKNQKKLMLYGLDKMIHDPSNPLEVERIAPSAEANKYYEQRIVENREKNRQAAKQVASQIIQDAANRKYIPAEGYVAVYIFQSKVGVKIGVSDSPAKRVKELQTGHPHKIQPLAYYWLPVHPRQVGLHQMP